MERPTLFSCRYKIPHQHGMSLADVFGHFEAAKAKVRYAAICAMCYVRCTVKLEMVRQRKHGVCLVVGTTTGLYFVTWLMYSGSISCFSRRSSTSAIISVAGGANRGGSSSCTAPRAEQNPAEHYLCLQTVCLVYAEPSTTLFMFANRVSRCC